MCWLHRWKYLPQALLEYWWDQANINGIKGARLFPEGAKTLVRTAQSGGGCPIPKNVKGRVVLGFEQPELAEKFPVNCRDVGLDELRRCLPSGSCIGRDFAQVSAGGGAAPAAEQQKRPPEC